MRSGEPRSDRGAGRTAAERRRRRPAAADDGPRSSRRRWRDKPSADREDGSSSNQPSISDDDDDPVDMSLMDQLFPVNHKTVFVVDHTPYFGLASSSRIQMDNAKRTTNGVGAFKSMWTCCIESVVEYCRIVWDLFPDNLKVIQVISSDVQSRDLNSWAVAHQNVNHMLHHLSNLGPPAKLLPNPSRDYSVVYGFRTAAEALSECTTAQTEHLSKKTNIELQNKCRAIIITSARDNPSIDNLMSMFLNELTR